MEAMKHILIPTDFSIHSLQPVHEALAAHAGTEVKITLLHLLRMPSGISDLLMLSRRSKPYELIREPFRDACNILKNRYASQLKDLRVEFQYGSTAAFLNNYLEATNVAAVYMLEHHPYENGHAQSADLRSAFRKIKTGLHYTQTPANERNTGRHALADLVPASDAVAF